MLRNMKKDPMAPSGLVINDPLYKVSWNTPQIIADLLKTLLMARLRLITIGTGPNSVYDWVTLPSRCTHGLGVAYLASKMLENNPELKSMAPTILAACLLHDAGSPSCSHLSEKYLKKLYGKNGETFLPFMIDYFSRLSDPKLRVKYILKSYGIKVGTIMDFVSGRNELGKILHGSMDLDNLDNIARFLSCIDINPKHPRFTGEDAIKIASSFNWYSSYVYDGWKLDNSAEETVSKWLDARKFVYDNIYSQSSIIYTAMLRRALYLADLAGELDMLNFFTATDDDGFHHLAFNCNIETSLLAKAVIYRRFFEQIVDMNFSAWPGKISQYAEDPLGDHVLADEVARHFSLKQYQICVMMTKHNGIRKINLQYVKPVKSLPEKADQYLFKVFVPQGFSGELKSEIASYIETKL